MNAQERLAVVTCRIASATSIARTRDQDMTRFVVNGGRSSDLEERTLAAVRRLELVADKLEKALS